MGALEFICSVYDGGAVCPEPKVSGSGTRSTTSVCDPGLASHPCIGAMAPIAAHGLLCLFLGEPQMVGVGERMAELLTGGWVLCGDQRQDPGHCGGHRGAQLGLSCRTSQSCPRCGAPCHLLVGRLGEDCGKCLPPGRCPAQLQHLLPGSVGPVRPATPVFQEKLEIWVFI